MSAVQANVDAEEATPPHTPEYDYVCAGKSFIVSDTKPKDFEFTECAAYSVTGRH